MKLIRCVECGRNREYRDEFPDGITAVCYWCYPIEERVKAADYQIPRRARFWQTDTRRWSWDKWSSIT